MEELKGVVQYPPPPRSSLESSEAFLKIPAWAPPKTGWFHDLERGLCIEFLKSSAGESNVQW